MNVQFERDGDHLVIDAETAAYFQAMDAQEMHAGYHTICRAVYRAAKGAAPAPAGDLARLGVD
ncbi:MAG: hypothetical protein VW405_08695, partial [Rhodospirillaceae bacterium]